MKRIIFTEQAPRAIASYSQAVEAGGFLYISGQIAIDPATGKLIDGDIKAQTIRVLNNLEAILHAAGYTKEDIIKATVIMADIKYFGDVNEVYKSFFSEYVPARAAFAASGLPMGALVEIEAIATKG